jgi:hypothetical protein
MKSHKAEIWENSPNKMKRRGKSLEQFMSFLLVRGREIILCKAQGLGFRV